MVVTKNSFKDIKGEKYDQRNMLSLNKTYSSFDENVTLETASTLSMSLSEDSNNPYDESPKYTNTHPRRSKKNNRQGKGNNNNNNNSHSNNDKGKGKGKGKGKRSQKRASKATSTKTHDAPMKRRDIYFALDCEMVGVGPEGLDSALARVSIVNWDNEIVLDTYVKVNKPVTDYRTFVSGIKPEQIESESAMALSDVQKLVTSTLQGKILIGHGLKNDLKVMGINHPWCDLRDTATYAPFMKTQESRAVEEQLTLCPRKLRDLVWEKLGKQIQVMGKAHSPVEDAIAAMDLYKAVRSEWETEMMKQVNTANKVNDERCRRLSPVRMVPKKISMADIGRMSLFPSNQYPCPPLMGYNHLQQHAHMSNSEYQAYYPSTMALEQARSRAALVHHQDMMFRLQHC